MRTVVRDCVAGAACWAARVLRKLLPPTRPEDLAAHAWGRKVMETVRSTRNLTNASLGHALRRLAAQVTGRPG